MLDTAKRVAWGVFNYIAMAVFCLGIFVGGTAIAFRKNPEHIDSMLRGLENGILFIISLF